MRLTPERIQQIESDINRLRSVTSNSVNLDADGAIHSVEILADAARPAKQVARDAEAILRHHGLTIDHRKIGVVQLEQPANQKRSQDPVRSSSGDNGQTEAPGAVPAILSLVPDPERVRLAAVHSTTRDGSFSVEVELTLGSYEGLPGRAEGPGQDPASCVGLVATATLEAVRNLLRPGYDALVRETRLLEAGGQPVVLVVVDFGEGRRTQRLTGACAQRGSLYDAAVYATLDAINRPLGQARFRQVTTLDAEADPTRDKPGTARA